MFSPHTAGLDFESASESLFFPAGTLPNEPQLFYFTVLEDYDLEDTEQVVVRGVAGPGATFWGDSVVNILDNDLNFVADTPNVVGQDIIIQFNTIPELLSATCSINDEGPVDCE